MLHEIESKIMHNVEEALQKTDSILSSSENRFMYPNL